MLCMSDTAKNEHKLNIYQDSYHYHYGVQWLVFTCIKKAKWFIPLTSHFSSDKQNHFEMCFLCVSQSGAALRRCLKSSEGELGKLEHTCLQLLDDLQGKRAAAQVDAAVVRMRRQQVDKRAMPAFLQQGALWC